MDDDELAHKLAQAPVGFAVLEGPDMVFSIANARYLEMISRTDIVGKAWVDVFPELVGSPTHETVRAVYGGQTIQVQEFCVPLVREGQIRDGFFSFTLDPTYGAGGEVTGFVVVAVEVTELVVRRHEAEVLAARLHESEARYRMLFEAMDDGFCLLRIIFDEAGRPVDYLFLEVNEAFKRHTGLVDPVNRMVSELVPDLDGFWFQRYGEVATTGKAARFENNAPAMGRWFDVFASRVGDPSLRQVGVVFKDVSARKTVELEKERLLIAEKEARREAEQSNRLKDDFLATVSHELRTPLNAMLGWVSLLRGGGVPPEKTGRALETIERNARSQAQLIEDLLDVSRILEGKLRIDVGRVDLRDVVDAAIEAVRPAANAKGVAIESESARVGAVMGDAQRLQQIVWNLLSNAVKFTPAGGQVDVRAVERDATVEISVIDNGKGIAKDFLSHVFERFRQAEGGSTRSQPGLGLGLSIVRQLTELHGGTVTASSQGEGLGSTFTVTLPIAAAQRIGTPLPSDSADQETARRQFPELENLDVLVVDDEKDSREMLAAVLALSGVRVRSAESVTSALEAFRLAPPAVVLSDIGMPELDGYALIKAIRAMPTAQGGAVPAVALTAFARSEDRTRCLLAGFDSHVAKPIEPMEILAVVASLASRRR